MSKMLDRDVIMSRAIDECLTEMYAKSQPSGDLKQIIADVKAGKITDGPRDHVFDRYYLSQAEFQYILDKYANAYGFKEHWKPDIELLESYLTEGGLKDIWVPEEMTKDGWKKPGYRSAEKVPSLLKQLQTLLENNELAEKVNDLVLENVRNCKNFYGFDREASQFSCAVALGASPTSNANTVKEYWAKQGVDVEIKERNPLLLWEMDEYGDEFEEAMKDEYGDDWEEHWWEEHRKNEELKRKEREEKLKELAKQYPDMARNLIGDDAEETKEE